MERFYYKKSRLNQLRGFCITVQEGCSARKAAKRLMLEPATVTKQISSLEDELGIKLFKRTTNHRLKITPEGQDFYNIAIIQLQGIDSLFGNFHEAQKEKKKNKLVIAVHQAVGAYIIPKYIKELLQQEKFKDTKIKLCNIPRYEAFKRLMNKKINFAFYSSSKHEEIPIEIEKVNIFKYKNALVINKNHPLAKKEKITKSDLSKYNYLLRDSFSFYDIRKSLNLKPSNITFENGTQEMTMGLVSENIDITGIPQILLENGTISPCKNIIYKNTDHLLPTSSYSLFYLKNTTHTESVNFLLDRIIKDQDGEYK